MTAPDFTAAPCTGPTSHAEYHSLVSQAESMAAELDRLREQVCELRVALRETARTEKGYDGKPCWCGKLGAYLLAHEPQCEVAARLLAESGFAWLIEAPGARYLAVRELGGWEFYWTQDHNAALRFYSAEQANAVQEAVRELHAGLFAFQPLLGVARPVEHGWLEGAKPEVGAALPSGGEGTP